MIFAVGTNSEQRRSIFDGDNLHGERQMPSEQSNEKASAQIRWNWFHCRDEENLFPLPIRIASPRNALLERTSPPTHFPLNLERIFAQRNAFPDI